MTDLIMCVCVCSKMRYYEKFVPSGVKELQLYGVYDSTLNDPDLHVYQCGSYTARCLLMHSQILSSK